MPYKNLENHIYYTILDGKKGKYIFADECDKYKFLCIVQQLQETYDCKVYAYCVMENNVHLIIECLSNQYEEAIGFLIKEYSDYYIRVKKRKMKVMLKKFRSKRVKNLIATCIDVHMLPVMAGMTSAPEDYWWSSYLSFRRRVIKRVIQPHNVLSRINEKKRVALKEFILLHQEYKKN